MLLLLALCTRGQTRCGNIYEVEHTMACCTPVTEPTAFNTSAPQMTVSILFDIDLYN